jgi:hypothetical protein
MHYDRLILRPGIPTKRQADQTFQKVILNRNRSKDLTRATELELGEVNVYV